MSRATLRARLEAATPGPWVQGYPDQPDDLNVFMQPEFCEGPNGWGIANDAGAIYDEGAIPPPTPPSSPTLGRTSRRCWLRSTPQRCRSRTRSTSSASTCGARSSATPSPRWRPCPDARPVRDVARVPRVAAVARAARRQRALDRGAAAALDGAREGLTNRKAAGPARKAWGTAAQQGEG